MARVGAGRRAVWQVLAAGGIFAAMLIDMFFDSYQQPEWADEVCEYGDNYMSYYFVLRSNLIELVLALVFIARSLLSRACLMTRLAAWGYVAVSLASVAQTLGLVTWEAYIVVHNNMVGGAIALLAALAIVRVLVIYIRYDRKKKDGGRVA